MNLLSNDIIYLILEINFVLNNNMIYCLIIILLIIFIFPNEIIKESIKLYRMKYGIDKNTCYKIMSKIDDIMKKNNVNYYFSEGTALGLFRNGDLIDWDDDIDMALDQINFGLFQKKCLPILLKNGYMYTESYCVNLDSNLISLTKNFHCVDIERVIPGRKCISKMGRMCDELIPHIQEIKRKKWRDRFFPVPAESYYEYLYGKDWKIPKNTKNQVN